MTVIQILLIAFALFALGRAFLSFRKGRLPMGWLLFWGLFWIAVGVVVVLPQTTQFAASLVGVGRGADLMVYLGMIAMFYLIFRLFVKLEDLESEITRLVRTLAIEKMEDEKEDV